MKTHYFILIITTLFLFGCKELADGDIGEIKIVNNSQHTVSIEYSLSYPDTILNDKIRGSCSILPWQTCSARSLHGWKGDISSNSSGVIMFFVSDEDTIQKYGAEAWRLNYLILKRYDLTEKDLEESGWTITYP